MRLVQDPESLNVFSNDVTYAILILPSQASIAPRALHERMMCKDVLGYHSAGYRTISVQRTISGSLTPVIALSTQGRVNGALQDFVGLCRTTLDHAMRTCFKPRAAN